MTTITITNDYFTDLNTAIAAGLFEKKGRNPKKGDLYAAIEHHNTLQISTASVYSDLLSQWKTRRDGISQNHSKKSVFFFVEELVIFAEAKGFEAAAERYKKNISYVKRAHRAYFDIYQQSVTIRDLFYSGKLSWAAIHKLAGHNPEKLGLDFIEREAFSVASKE